MNQAEPLYRPGFFPNVRPIATITARIWIEQGRLSETADRACERVVSVDDEARYLSEFDHLTLVRLLLAGHRGRPDSDVVAQAARLLDQLCKVAAATGRAGNILEIRLAAHLARYVADRDCLANGTSLCSGRCPSRNCHPGRGTDVATPRRPGSGRLDVAGAAAHLGDSDACTVLRPDRCRLKVRSIKELILLKSYLADCGYSYAILCSFRPHPCL